MDSFTSSNIEKIVELYFKGYSAKEALNIIRKEGGENSKNIRKRRN